MGKDKGGINIMKLLDEEQIDNIKQMASKHFDRPGLRAARDNFYIIKQKIEDKPIDEWTLTDVRKLLQAFNIGCTNATTSTCSIVRRAYFKVIKGQGQYEDFQFCVPCFFKNFCAGSPLNQREDGWHWNMILLRNHLMSATSKDDLDKDYILERIAKIQASNDLQELHDFVELWGGP